MGIVRSATDVEDYEESNPQNSSYEDDTNCIKPLHKKLCLPSKNTPANEEDEEASKLCIKPLKRETRGSNRDIRKLDSSDNVVSRGKVQEKPYQRVWSKDDEITLLKSMVKLKKQHAIQPNAYEAILSYTINSLGFQPTLFQLKEKIRRLREEYKSFVRSPMKIMNSDHEIKLLKLSRKVWDHLLDEKLATENRSAEQSQIFLASGTNRGDCCSKRKETLKKGI